MGYKINIAPSIATIGLGSLIMSDDVFSALESGNVPAAGKYAMRAAKSNILPLMVGAIGIKYFLGSPITKGKGAKVLFG